MLYPNYTRNYVITYTNNTTIKPWCSGRPRLYYDRNQIFICKFLLQLWYGQIQDCRKLTTWIFEGLNTFEINWMTKIYIYSSGLGYQSHFMHNYRNLYLVCAPFSRLLCKLSPSTYLFASMQFIHFIWQFEESNLEWNPGPLLRMCNWGKGLFRGGPGEVPVGKSVLLQLPTYICMV
jgi:hypothetical protein